jgi:hypothetical protein
LNKNSLKAAALAAALAAAGPARAAHFGLGSAVAARGAKVLDKAAPSLPSCGGNLTLFTQAPVTDPTLASINPLGHLIPPGHTFPSDHLYFNFNPATSGSVNFYAPSDGWVTQVTEAFTGSGPPTLFSLAFNPCAEVTLNFLGVNGVVSTFTNPPGPSVTTCSSDGMNYPGATGSCVINMQVPVKAGQLLGTGPASTFDFGPLEDTRFSLTGFANPSRHDLNRGFCPLNYFTAGVQATYDALLGGNGNASFLARSTAPICGTIMQDVPGTAQGDWYFPGAPNMPDNPHLALVHDNISPSTATFSVGSSVPGFAGGYSIFPKSARDGTRIDYDFNLVNDTQIYCYDGFQNVFNSGLFSPNTLLAGRVALIQLSGSSLSVLTIELLYVFSDFGNFPSLN